MRVVAKNPLVVMVDLLAVSPYHDIELCRSLREAGCSVVLAASGFAPDPDVFRRSSVDRLPFMIDVASLVARRKGRLRTLIRLGEYFANVLIVTFYVALKAPAAVHIQWLPLLDQSSIELWWLRFLRRLGPRVVLTVHNAVPHDEGTGGAYQERLVRAVTLADAVICHSEVVARDLIVEGAAEPTVQMLGQYMSWRAVPDRAAGRRFLLSSLNISSETSVVLFLGTIRPYKGLEFLLEAWSLMDPEAPTAARLVVAGSGDASYVQSLSEVIAAEPSRESVSFVSKRLSDSELLHLHAAADVVVMPYSGISQSGALLLAARFSAPVVATAVGGFAEQLENGRTALLADFGDAPAFGASVARLLRDEALRASISSNLSRELSGDRWREAALATIDVYELTSASGN